ncbi:MAG: phosphoribosylanthranilate isomerase [Pseudomonadota bacterium]
MSFEVKICGVARAEDIAAAARAGAAQVGFVFFARSPRNLSPDRAAALAEATPARLAKVALFVDASDGEIDEAVNACAPDWLQFHGRETPARVAAAKARWGRPILKALGVRDRADVAGARAYAGAAARVLYDAKPPEGAERPGGLGAAFDWSALTAAAADIPWMLSGGLTPANVGEAVARANILGGFCGVDVSSGVESAPGRKDARLIEAFVEAARSGAQDFSSVDA